jgi:hypothetical protein
MRHERPDQLRRQISGHRSIYGANDAALRGDTPFQQVQSASFGSGSSGRKEAGDADLAQNFHAAGRTKVLMFGLTLHDSGPGFVE